MGFAPFAEVTEGFDVVKDITAEYGQQPDQGMIRRMGNEYLNDKFPNMDYIKEATVILPDSGGVKEKDSGSDNTPGDEKKEQS